MTTAQRDALCTTDCPQGLIIYNTDANCIEFLTPVQTLPGGRLAASGIVSASIATTR
jgi:hypothetical protein